jgi:peptide/nickel transport system permease protein
LLKYIARRLFLAIPMLLGLTIVVFAMMHLLPGDPAEVILAQSGARPEAVARLREQLFNTADFWVGCCGAIWGPPCSPIGR